jgi:hypothetical protein
VLWIIGPSGVEYAPQIWSEVHIVVLWVYLVVIELILPLAKTFEDVQKRVAALTKDRILVGHAVHNDLKVSALISCS